MRCTVCNRTHVSHTQILVRARGQYFKRFPFGWVLAHDGQVAPLPSVRSQPVAATPPGGARIALVQGCNLIPHHARAMHKHTHTHTHNRLFPTAASLELKVSSSGQSKGWAIAQFTTAEEAEAAIQVTDSRTRAGRGCTRCKICPFSHTKAKGVSALCVWPLAHCLRRASRSCGPVPGCTNTRCAGAVLPLHQTGLIARLCADVSACTCHAL